jgi:methionine-S-sulfoxide reductase
MNQHDKTETIVFGGGCFWCTEAVFQNLRGVVSVIPGFTGGTEEDPSYWDVAEGRTGHAEVVRVVYDSGKVALDDLLTVFFATHDPTSVNRQGADVGTQYRSAVFYTTEEQRQTTKSFIEDINNSSSAGKRVVTEVTPLEKFYEAGESHTEYYRKNSGNAYCQIVINPKLEKVQREFANLLKTT